MTKSKSNLELVDQCESHKVSYKKRYLLVAWSRKAKCDNCQLRVEEKEPYRSLFVTIFATMVIFLGVLFWAYLGFWISIILTLIISHLCLALIAVVMPLRTERGVKKLK